MQNFRRLTPFALAFLCMLSLSESASAARRPRATPAWAITRLENARRPVESFASRVEAFIRESGAQTLQRGFAPVKDGVPGAPKKVITISRDAFPIFKEYFSGTDVLFVYHAPNSRVLISAFAGMKGEQGRLLDEFSYNFGGTLLIPIVLSPEESARAQDFFTLAGKVSYRLDVALYPWLLKDERGNPYVPAGNPDLLSEWFMRMPIGAAFDESERRATYVTTGLNPEIATLAQRVWTAPYGHQTLAQALDLRPADPVRLFKTPGTVASALLSTAAPERVPVVFRFVEDYATPLADDFNAWIDVEFDPGQNG